MKSKLEVIANFKKKYDYLSATEVENLYEIAKNNYLDIAFPFEPNVVAIPTDRPRAYTWIYDCMGEILERSGCASMTSYSENGLSITWDKSGISKGLLNRAMPKAGVL